ncbi:putative anti-sigma regulatory factor, serine/threonine protein kinase [Thermomonospora curvata DSM 43183]|uniref:Putative anti-sigma regulatory factor, serine/threonine protein kinase n=1 Tax=Thermomonospora curvata (strain ATCC 19995 / DSM 43183 / JCM 3096 / KCTC 9072 / NBRC 15933 / NCIMB 10081 / Henssen B9) TaxID=471852 RepID=D1A6I9_THECD|nr:putative anti-sigma regulatory factor, serine/threonine protein kinase [Thermomonospora curvata DSM 43183]
MTSHHTREEPRWGWASVVSAGCGPTGTAVHSTASTPVPESLELAPAVEQGLRMMIDDAAGTACFTVWPDPESVTAARHFTTRRLSDWNMDAIADDVALVVTELVTNALRHSVPSHDHLMPMDRPYRQAPGRGGAIRLRMRRRRSDQSLWLLCGVFDGCRQAPRRKEPDYIAETGRGLHLVDSFTHSWGWRGLPDGKVVWALFRHP